VTLLEVRKTRRVKRSTDGAEVFILHAGMVARHMSEETAHA
jgi:hypothetical protein